MPKCSGRCEMEFYTYDPASVSVYAHLILNPVINVSPPPLTPAEQTQALIDALDRWVRTHSPTITGCQNDGCECVVDGTTPGRDFGPWQASVTGHCFNAPYWYRVKGTASMNSTVYEGRCQTTTIRDPLPPGVAGGDH